MKNAVGTPFESLYGFRGPGFSVDNEGNIIATSIVTSDSGGGDVDAGGVADFIVSEQNDSGNFVIEGYVGNFPTIELARGRTYRFSLELTTIDFSITDTEGDLYNIGLTHSDGSVGADAQGKQTGVLQISVPNNAPDELRYSNGVFFGIINVVDPIGLFSSVNITSETNSTAPSNGVLTVAGGMGIQKDLYIGGELNLAGLGIPKVDSLTNLELNAANKIILSVDNTKIGEIKSTGLEIPIENSTINNTTIGATTPATATFTTAKVNTQPSVNTDVTNKNYVDSTVTALAIALGT